MSGIVGGYSVNNWLAAAAVGYTVVSTPSIMDARAAIQGDKQKSAVVMSEQSGQGTTIVRLHDNAAASRVDLAGKAKQAKLSAQSVQRQQAAQESQAEAWRLAMQSPQAQSLAAIQPAQILMSSADFAQMMEDAQSQERGGKSSRFAQMMQQESSADAQHEALEKEASEAEEATLQQATDPLSALHALFKTADGAYQSALHPPQDAVLSLVG